MSDETKPDAGKPAVWHDDTPAKAEPEKKWYQRINPQWIGWALMMLTALALTWLGQRTPPPPVPDVPIFVAPSFGWGGSEGEEAALRNFPVGEFADTPAAILSFGPLPDSVFLWKAVEKCWAIDPLKDGRPYPIEDQAEVGMCVGMGAKHSGDASLANEIVYRADDLQLWEPLSAEAIYAAGKEVGKNKGPNNRFGDGSYGPNSHRAIMEMGYAPMRKYRTFDLSRFDRYRGRLWASTDGTIPAEIRAEMANHKALTCVRIRSYDELQKALSQGYAAHICSGVGFEGKKDSQGFQRPQGSWAHCMAIMGYQSKRPGILVQNSWSPAYFHVGAKGEGDPPGCSFWVDRSFAEKWISDPRVYVYAVSGIQGFVSRDPKKLDWLLRGANNGDDRLLTFHKGK